MLMTADSPEALRSKIKEDLDLFDLEELKKLYDTIAVMAAERAIKLANHEWLKKGISREKVTEEVEQYRHSLR